MADTLCLYTHLKNISGVQQVFGFLPPHGKELAAAASTTVFGDIWDRLGTGGRLNERKKTALEAAIQNNVLTIIKTPALFLYDVPNAETKIVDLASGSLGVIDPCYGSYSGPP